MYRVIISKQILKSLDKIPVAFLSSIRGAVNNLANNPRPSGCVKLVGSENTYRIRVGVYRIVYKIEDGVLTVKVVKVDHRSNVYRKN